MRLSKPELDQLRFIKVLSLLRHKQIDPTRSADEQYVLKTFRGIGVDQGVEYHIYIQTEIEFIEQARHAAKAKAKASAIVLLFTAVEHITNHYVRVFGEMRGLTAPAISDMIRGCSHNDKLSWLASLLGFSLPATLTARIAELRSARNKIVHIQQAPYVARAANETEDSWATIERSIRAMRMRQLLAVPDRLRTYLEDTFQRTHPDIPKAYELMKTLRHALRKEA